MKSSLLILFLLLAQCAFSQSAQLTPVTELGSHAVSVSIPSKFTGSFPAGKTLRVPTNYTVSVYHAGGLIKPRFMAFSPTGVLHVTDMSAGKVFALPDLNNDGVADTIREVASGFTNNHDLKFYKGALYVTESNRIWKCTDTNADGIYETKIVFIDNIGNGLGGHVTRTFVFDSIRQKVYVSIGSSCNVCRETERAIIEEYDENGTNGRVMATGVRNAVGMALHPFTNRLWANNNGSDQQGNEIPPEWIDLVRDNGFYGHPFAYGGGVWFNFNANADYQALLPITSTDSSKVARMVHPAALVRAHSAPMALQFLNAQFGPDLQNGFLSALRGSWNTTNPKDFRGYKVIYGHLSSPQDTTVDYVSDFCSGFITDTVNRIFWGRPVGLALDKFGKVYISSDEGNKFILVLTPDHVSGALEYTPEKRLARVYPNPANNRLAATIDVKESSNVYIDLLDLSGRPVMVLMEERCDGLVEKEFDTTGLPNGLYVARLRVNGETTTQKLCVVH